MLNNVLPSPKVKIAATNGATRAIVEKRLEELASLLTLNLGHDIREQAEREQAYLKDLLIRKYS